MAQVIAAVAPRVIIPGFFLGQKVSKMSDPVAISQTIAFTGLFISAVLTLFQGKVQWLGIIPGVAAMAYYYMLNDPANTEKYRYADWAITTPLMLTAILLANKAPVTLIASLGLLDLEMIAAGYLGTQAGDASVMFKYFCVSCLAFLPILYFLTQQKTALLAVYLTLAVWLLYPVLYYLREVDVVSAPNTAVFYSVMDMVAKIGLVNLLHV